uniref:non-specific serine/threonine protein kinase n=1 Tax=Oryzias sinensis TaxID=183150 RepID=A0A8C7XML0_9TELE
MTSRRTMTRSFSGNGRTSSFSEEEGSSSSSRSESRNTYLSNVRPENRSTLCSVMAQLTEDIQPTFETTLKPKAVSENCNVKFSCVVSGYPTPELKWYKDDVEMDRYCGLPKYEIRRNGKTHTLHIYNCTLDDAAIYQVSASNSKGIVSCSGVLEVGTMNEYKIHQRFFAKLKQKAERKKKDLEDQTKKVSKENIQKKELQRSPEHPQRKRSIPLADKLSVELPGEAAMPNGIGSDLKDMDTSPINVESRPEETLARKRIRISNGVNVEPQDSSNSGSDRTHIMGNGGENCYDGGIGLAQFLAETRQSQTAEERPILPEEELPKDMDTSTCRENKEKDQEEMRNKSNNQEKALQEEHEKDKRTEEELVVDREKQQEMMHATAHGKWSSDVNNQNKGHKDHDPHHIQASISSMFHSVKDFFFGKGKKDSRDQIENEDKELNKSNTKVQPCQLDMPPSFHLQPEHTQLTQESVDHQSDKTEEDLSGGSTPTSSLSCESSPRLKRRDSLTLIRSATPEELASGARRKIFISKTKEEMEGSMFGMQDSKKESPYMSPSQARRAALLQPSIGQKTPPVERRSPLLNRRKATLDVPKVMEEPSAGEPVGSKTEDKLAEKKIDPLKAPQVIRKIRAEPFPDASGHLKLWCQFFNVLTDSTIKWYKEDDEILEIKRSGGDESQVALAIVLASNQDCGVYGCTISNDYGSDTTDFLLSSDVLSEILLKDDLEVGEEIEMTPLLFTRGLADCGSWGEKYFGRIFTEALQVGEGCTHKTSRVKVIYGLDPVFESGSTCIIKIQNPISYGNRQETNLTERNLDITKQECKVQNLIREYCKIFAAEARVIENFGLIPRYLMYRPANSVPYATVESDLSGTFTKYCTMGPKDQLISQNTSEIEQKCCTFQHWIHQWTHGNLLVTQLEGVETKLTNVKVVTKSKGYQGLTECGSPQVFDQFLTHHQCTYYCGLLGLRPLRSLDTLQQPAKIKGSKSPLLNRKLSTGSPQLQRKGQSPQMSRKGNSSPKVAKKVQATDDSKTGGENKPEEGYFGRNPL